MNLYRKRSITKFYVLHSVYVSNFNIIMLIMFFELILVYYTSIEFTKVDLCNRWGLYGVRLQKIVKNWFPFSELVLQTNFWIKVARKILDYT